MATIPSSSAVTHAQVNQMLFEEQPTQWTYLDVRTAEEFATGHIPGAYNIPFKLGDLAGLRSNPEFLALVEATFPRESRLILGCRSGARAATAEQLLREAGYAEIVVHEGSLVGTRDAFGRQEPGWLALGAPITQTPQPGRTYAELSRSLHQTAST